MRFIGVLKRVRWRELKWNCHEYIYALRNSLIFMYFLVCVLQCMGTLSNMHVSTMNCVNNEKVSNYETSYCYIDECEV